MLIDEIIVQVVGGGRTYVRPTGSPRRSSPLTNINPTDFNTNVLSTSYINVYIYNTNTNPRFVYTVVLYTSLYIIYIYDSNISQTTNL